MKERPILFSAPMVRAILDGRKTQTRRVMKPQPSPIPAGSWDGCEGQHWWQCRAVSSMVEIERELQGPDKSMAECLNPYGQRGDRLWVRETHSLQTPVEDEPPPHSDGRPVKWRSDDCYDEVTPRWVQAHYKATDPAPDLCCERDNCRQCRENDMGPHWKPSIHMPRWASRILLEVTGVRVERLKSISDADAIAEGCPGGHGSIPGYGYNALPGEQFHSLWESINGAGSWAANPWVWVIEFKAAATP